MGGYIVLEEKCSWVLKDPAQKRRGELLRRSPAVLAREMDDKPGVTFRIGDRRRSQAKTDFRSNILGTLPTTATACIHMENSVDVNRADLAFSEKAGETAAP